MYTNTTKQFEIKILLLTLNDILYLPVYKSTF